MRPVLLRFHQECQRYLPQVKALRVMREIQEVRLGVVRREQAVAEAEAAATI